MVNLVRKRMNEFEKSISHLSRYTCKIYNEDSSFVVCSENDTFTDTIFDYVIDFVKKYHINFSVQNFGDSLVILIIF